MLKAIWLDDVEQIDIIKYITEYQDVNGIPNSSEALRILLKTGYNVLVSRTPVDENFEKTVDIEHQSIQTTKNNITQPNPIIEVKNDLNSDGSKQSDLYKIIELLVKQQEMFLNTRQVIEKPNDTSSNNELMLQLMTTLVDKLTNQSNQAYVKPNKKRLKLNKSTIKVQPLTIDKNIPHDEDPLIIDFKRQESDRQIRHESRNDNLTQTIDDNNTLLQNILNNSNR